MMNRNFLSVLLSSITWNGCSEVSEVTGELLGSNWGVTGSNKGLRMVINNGVTVSPPGVITCSPGNRI